MALKFPGSHERESQKQSEPNNHWPEQKEAASLDNRLTLANIRLVIISVPRMAAL